MAFHERLLAPFWWWLIVAGFAVSMAVAVWTFLGPTIGLIAIAVFVTFATWLVLGYGWVRISVDDHEIRAGPARLEWPWVGTVTALDEEETKAALSVAADPRAYLVTRPYIATAVRIEVNDPADPHPYWLVSSRNPDDFVAAAQNARGCDD